MKKIMKHFSIREDKQHEIEVHVAGICLRLENKTVKVLIAKRQKARQLYPEKWECGGGQVKRNENFEDAIIRQFHEEFGLKINIIQPFATYEIIAPSPSYKIPGLEFLCTPVNGGNIKLNKREFSEYRWIPPREVKKFDFIAGIQQDIIMAVKIFESLANSLAKKQEAIKKIIKLSIPYYDNNGKIFDKNKILLMESLFNNTCGGFSIDEGRGEWINKKENDELHQASKEGHYAIEVSNGMNAKEISKMFERLIISVFNQKAAYVRIIEAKEP